MNEKKADLHLHTNFSDSTFSPEEVVAHAVSMGLSAIAITDHDSVSGVQPAIDAGSKLNIEVIPGIEMTTGIDGNEVHVLGYYIDWKEECFQSRLRELCRARVERVSEMVRKLNRIGIDLSADEVMKINGNPESVGRLHVALALVHKKIVSSVEEAFQKFLKKGCPAYVGVESLGLTPSDAIHIIRRLKGVPVLAHPKLMGSDEYIPDYLRDGLMGIEVYHSDQPQNISRYYRSVADKYKLLITGGSDCHGLGKGKVLIGNVQLPYIFVERLKSAHERLLHEISHAVSHERAGKG